MPAPVGTLILMCNGAQAELTSILQIVSRQPALIQCEGCRNHLYMIIISEDVEGGPWLDVFEGTDLVHAEDQLCTGPYPLIL